MSFVVDLFWWRLLQINIKFPKTNCSENPGQDWMCWLRIHFQVSYYSMHWQWISNYFIPTEQGVVFSKIRCCYCKLSFRKRENMESLTLMATKDCPLKQGTLSHLLHCEPGGKWWCHRSKLTSSVISDVRPIVYMFVYISINQSKAYSANMSGVAKLSGVTAKLVSANIKLVSPRGSLEVKGHVYNKWPNRTSYTC